MAEILVLVEHVDGTPKKVTYELLTLARSLGEPSAVFLGGADSRAGGRLHRRQGDRRSDRRQDRVGDHHRRGGSLGRPGGHAVDLRWLHHRAVDSAGRYADLHRPPQLNGSGAVELGRTVKIGVPACTVDCTMVEPPKIDCVATRSAETATASVMIPDPVLTAVRPAISLPSMEEAASTAAGDFSATSWASTSALGATT